MMEALQRKFEECDIAFDAVDHRIMCYAHIVNLSSGCVIRAASEGEDTLGSNPIEHACGVVWAIRVSGKCRDAFDEIVKLGNTNKWFKVGNPSKVVMLMQLLQDVHTCWDSIFFMLNRLHKMHLVLLSLPMPAKCFLLILLIGR
jgi:hypothetical protein